MIYVELYLLTGVLYTSLLYDILQEYYRRNLRRNPLSKELSDKQIEDVIKYGPLVVIVVWPLSLFNLILNTIKYYI